MEFAHMTDEEILQWFAEDTHTRHCFDGERSSKVPDDWKWGVLRALQILARMHLEEKE